MDSYNNSDDWNDYYEAILPKSINFSKTSSTQTFRYSRSHRRAKSYTSLIKELLEQVQEDLKTEVDIDLHNAQLSLLDILGNNALITSNRRREYFLETIKGFRLLEKLLEFLSTCLSEFNNVFSYELKKEKK